MRQVAVQPVAIEHARPVRAPLPGFHLGLAALMTVIVVLGFRQYYAGLFTGAATAHPIIHAHAAVFSGWLVLLLAQVSLVLRRRVATHRSVGRIGIVYGAGLLLFGVFTGFVAPALNVVAGTMTLDEAAGFLILPVGDMLLFGAFFIAAIRTRRNREAHVRLMVLAAVALIFPGAARFALPAGAAAVLAVWLLPLVAAMAHDRYAFGRVHRLYWLGLGACVVAFGRVALMEAEVWLAVARPVITALLPLAGG
jgi:hypothetical protein